MTHDVSGSAFIRTLKKSFDKSENFRARIQGFADHSEEDKSKTQVKWIERSLKTYSR